ncbi:MAG: hypothetical protein IJ065_08455, partial [Eubacterium sp.]|nr:hypothetical protein [Eubacterium sp.]
GASIIIRDSKDEVVDEWTSTKDVHETVLKPGTYTLNEEAEPEGYDKVETTIEFEVDAEGKVTVTKADTTGLVKVNDEGIIVVANAPTQPDETTVKISKVDAGTGDEISGAKMQLTDTDDNVVADWESTDKPHEVTLKPGTYTIHEETAPKGYEVVKTDITFTVDENGNVTLDKAVTTGVSEVKDGVIVVKDEPEKNDDVTVKISKVALGGEELEGASIIIRDSKDEVVDEWTSTKDVHETVLKPGTYTLNEEAAPEGYDKVETTIEFEVDAEGKVTVTKADTTGLVKVNDEGVIVVANAPTQPDETIVKISKVDAGTGDEIPGAKMQLTDSDDNVVADWESTDKPHEVTLKPGTYTIHEETAPKGYDVVKTDITFTVDADGKVTLDSAVTTGVSEVVDGVIVVKDEPLNTVKVSKVDAGTGKELEGAKIVLKDSEGNEVDTWISEKKPHEVELIPGTYTIIEDTAPEGYDTVHSEITFTVDSDGNVTLNDAVTTGVSEVNEDGVLLVKDEPLKGSIVITKSFDGNNVTEEEQEGGLQFQVTTTVDNKTVWLDSEGNLSETEVTLTLANDFTYDEAGNTWTKTFDNVPIGKYTVEETNTTIEGYNFKGSTFNGVEKANNKVEITVEADEESKVEIVDAYEQVASLTVKKAVTDEAAAAAADKTYRIALKNSAGKYFNGTEFTDSEKYFEISIAEPYTFENLPVDQTYTVVEDLGDDNAKVELTGFAFEGYEVADVELGKDDATVTITNKYTRDKGDLVITKLVKGPVTEEEFNGALTFTVVDAKGNEINVTKNDGTTGSSKNMTIKDYFELVSGENGEFTYKLTIKDVPTGKYTVTETNSTFDGYELVSEHGGGSVNVVKGEEAISNFVDEYQPSTGTLEIVKDFKNAPTNLEASKMVFEISGPAHFNNGENLIVTYADFTDGKYVIENAPIGRYTVTETAQEDAKVDGSDKYTFSKEASTVTGSREVLKGATATVTLKNVYEKNEILGSLTVNKTVSMNDGSPVPEETFVSDKVFNITVQNTDTGLYVAGDGEYSESPVEHQISGGQAVVFNNLKLGNYTVSEDVADATKVDYRVIYDGSESVPEATAALTADSKNANVSISNVYRHYEPEEIVDYPVFFSKEDSLSGAEVPGATIELYKGESATGTPYKTWVSSLTSHVENLEEGKYTFKETVAPEGYDIVTTEIKFEVMKDDSEKGYSVSLIDLSDEVLKAAKQRDDGTLVLKNDPMLGLLKVVKVVKTDTGNIPVVDGFHVTIQNLKNGLYVQNTDGVLGSAAKDILIPIGEDGVGSVEVKGLRPATYLVVEKDADAKNVAGFIYDANGSISEVNGLIELDKSEVTVTLENDYVEDVGTLEVTKTVTGDAPADKTEFKVTVKNADGKYLTADGKVSDEKAVLTVKAGEKLTFNNIPSGKYTVEEDVEDAENVVGYKYNSEASVVAKDATVTHDKTATVELINDYTETSTGFIEVHVTEEKSGKDVHDATVVITNKKTGEEFTYKTDKEGKIVDENGKTPEVPAGEYTVTIKDVPKGYDISTGEKGDVTVPKNETGKHEAVIKTERGGIVITVYDEETGNVVPNAEVTITTPDGNTKTFITDSEGQVKEYSKTDEYGNYTQEPGTFTYVVTKVPTGYKVTTGESQTGVVEAGKLTELEARISPKTGGLDIQVLDEKTLEPVVNAVVEIKTPDGAKVEITTDQNGMINKFVEKDKNGNYTAKVGEYDITVIKVPEGYSVTTGQTKTETVVEGEVKHHVAKIDTAKNSTDTDTTNKNNTNKDTSKNNNTTVNNNKNSTKKTDTNAKTADEADIAGVAGLMLLSLAAVVEIIRRKKEDEE